MNRPRYKWVNIYQFSNTKIHHLQSSHGKEVASDNGIGLPTTAPEAVCTAAISPVNAIYKIQLISEISSVKTIPTERNSMCELTRQFWKNPMNKSGKIASFCLLGCEGWQRLVSCL